jgi:hypothetical protein
VAVAGPRRLASSCSCLDQFAAISQLSMERVNNNASYTTQLVGKTRAGSLSDGKQGLVKPCLFIVYNSGFSEKQLSDNQATQFQIKALGNTKIATQLRLVPSLRMLDASLCTVRTASLLHEHRNVTALFRRLKVMILRILCTILISLIHSFIHSFIHSLVFSP